MVWIGDRETTVASSECPEKPEFAAYASLRSRTPLVRLVRPSKTSLRSSAPSVPHSRLVVPPTSRFSNRRHPFCRTSGLPQTSTPLQSMTPAPWRPRCRRCTHSHEVSAPTALPIRQDPPLLGFAFPGHVASSHLPCASTPYSLSGLPGVLPTRRARGASPFRASPNRNRRRLSAGHPLLRLANRPP